MDLADGDAADRLEALIALSNEISAAITTRPANKIPELMTDMLVQVPDISAAGVWLLTPGGTTARPYAWRGQRQLETNAMPAVELTRTGLGQAVAGPTQLDGPPVARQLLPPDWLGAAECVAFAGFPLILDETPRGVLGLFCRRRLTDAEQGLLTLLARQAAAELARSETGGTSASAPRTPQVEFIARIAHELRTPLTAVRGNIQLVSMAIRKGDYERAPRRLETTLQQVDNIVALIQNLQDISQIERGRLVLSFRSGDLTAALWRAAQRIERSIASDRHMIRLQVPEPMITVHDAIQMEQAFFNLLSNAVAYSPLGGTIEVHAEQAVDGVSVTIADQGVGIPLAEQQRIFEPFFRATTAEAVSAKGLGLGLTISRAIVERHGGRIDVRSQPGQGSIFTVRVPLAPPTA